MSSNPNHVDVRVRAASRVEEAQASGLQDLRLFRDGQLASRLPGWHLGRRVVRIRAGGGRLS